MTDLGQSYDARATGIVLDASGNPYLAGTSSSAQFSTLRGVANLGPDFILGLDASTGSPQTLFRFPSGVVTAPPVFDRNGRLLLIGAQNALLTFAPSYATPSIVGYANSASNALNTGISPGALVTFYGFSLPSSMQDVQVFIGNLPAPVIYTGPNQINWQVPFEINDDGMPLPAQVIVPGATISLQLPWSPAIGIFTVDGTYAAALNQDGTVNSASNPAAQGSIVTLFGTGAVWPAGMPDGAVATTAIRTQSSFQLEYFPESAAVLYAGTAPGLIDGVFRVNLQLPPQLSVPLTLQQNPGLYATLASNPVRLYLK